MNNHTLALVSVWISITLLVMLAILIEGASTWYVYMQPPPVHFHVILLTVLSSQAVLFYCGYSFARRKPPRSTETR